MTETILVAINARKKADETKLLFLLQKHHIRFVWAQTPGPCSSVFFDKCLNAPKRIVKNNGNNTTPETTPTCP
jgi:hypothetical protein